MSTIAEKLQSDFAPYVLLIQKSIRRNNLQDKSRLFDERIIKITKQNPIDRFKEHLESIPLECLGFETIDEVEDKKGQLTIEKSR